MFCFSKSSVKIKDNSIPKYERQCGNCGSNRNILTMACQHNYCVKCYNKFRYCVECDKINNKRSYCWCF